MLFNKKKSVLLLHVGFPKTATTALQQHVFSDLPGVLNLGKPGIPANIKKALRHIAADDPDRFDRKHIRSMRRAVRRARRESRRIVVSHEGMTGSRRIRCGRSKVIRERGFHALRIATAKRLYDSFGKKNVQILFTIREQRSWMLSTFADLVLREGLSMDLAEWVRRGLEMPDDFYADPDFDRTIALYESLWGRERVHVLVYEEMNEDPDGFARRLAERGGFQQDEIARRIRSLPETKTRTELSNPENPYSSKRTNRAELDIARSLSIPHVLDTSSEKSVISRCAAGNRAISRRFGIDLESWGYAVDPAS